MSGDPTSMQAGNTPEAGLNPAALIGGNMEAFSVLKDIPVTISIELGRTRMSLAELLALGPGSVVELNRMVDEPMDVLVNGTLIARGEVVVIDDNFGIRMTEVISPASGG